MTKKKRDTSANWEGDNTPTNKRWLKEMGDVQARQDKENGVTPRKPKPAAKSKRKVAPKPTSRR